jgi:hypothetical protein
MDINHYDQAKLIIDQFRREAALNTQVRIARNGRPSVLTTSVRSLRAVIRR